jgi:Spy/CpxP family protein refolding chaperone
MAGSLHAAKKENARDKAGKEADNGRMKSVVLALTLAAAACAAVPAAAQENLLPPGPGRAEVIAACGDCHGLPAVVHTHLSAAAWDQMIRLMQAEGAYVPSENIPAMVEYLASHFGPPPAAAAPAAK